MSSNTLVAATARPMILALLLSGESYGYQILKRIRTVSGGTIKWSSAMLYPVLRRMEDEGLIRSDWRMSEKHRMRKYYMLTDRGRKEMDVEKAKWSSIQKTMKRMWDMAEAAE